jgi:hypothetical protein
VAIATGATGGITTMKSEVALLNLLCVIAALVFVALALLNALFSGNFLTTDNLFVTLVCLVMALMFAAIPVLYLKDQGKLPMPFQRKELKAAAVGQLPQSTPPLLDAKGRPVPPDVRSMVANMKQKQPEHRWLSRTWPAVNKIEKLVLGSFEQWKKEKLDLHTLFEVGENDPEARTAVFDAVERLVEQGLLQEEGNDFYSLTERGRAATGRER